MTAAAAFAGLEGLLDLVDGNATDICASLLRTLTDLYLQRPIHTPEDEHYYTELALRLIDAAEVSERAALAVRLASYPSAPLPVLERLARDVVEVAGPILEHSPHLRSTEGETMSEAALDAQSIGTEPSAAQPAARGAGPLAAAAELAELFYRATAPERRLILINLDYAPFSPSHRLPGVRGVDIWRLEAAALRRKPETLTREFERLLGVSATQARRILDDRLGEPIVVAAKALDLSNTVLQCLLPALSLWVGQWADRVHELAQLYREISRDAACRLITIWREAARAESSPVQDEPVPWRAAAENARRALSEVSRRSAVMQACPVAKNEFAG
jgi:hypothetical protein